MRTVSSIAGPSWNLRVTLKELLLAASITLLGVLSAALGVWATGLQALTRRIVSFSGGILIGISLFWVLPEIAGEANWIFALVWLTAGFCVLWFTDRFVHPVCPTCSHTHDHERCSNRLHGMATPLIAAASVHAFLDGWSLAASQQDGGKLGFVLLVGIALHKIPEGLALGVIVRSALKRPGGALIGCAFAESATLAGAILAAMLAPSLGRLWGAQWVHALLAIAGGSFLYLGYHAVHSEYRRRGMMPALAPALSGVAGSTFIRLFGSSFHRMLGG